MEWHARDDPRWDDFVEDPSIIEHGAVTLPDDSRLGVTLELGTVEEFVADGEPLPDPE